MIKSIMLVFEPKLAWDGIALARKSVGQVLMFFLMPLIFLSVAGEMAGLVCLGKNHELAGNFKPPVATSVVYGAAQLALSFAVVFIGAKAVKALTDNFQVRNNFAQCFTVVAYAFGPLFLVRLLDALPNMHPWATFGIGIVLCIATLYHGIPRVIEPDPALGFGIYVMSAFLLAGMAALARFLTLLILTSHPTGMAGRLF